MTTFGKLADLPLAIDRYSLEPLEQNVSSGFLRKSTLIHLSGAGATGTGEDVTYDAVDHDIAQAEGATLPLAGEWTVGSFCEHFERLDAWPQSPQREVSRNYRLWGYESAALDLALQQGQTSLHAALGRVPRPVEFVCSLRLNDAGEPPDLGRVTERLKRYPTLRFKLDPTPDWDDALISALVETGAVDSVDFKGLYEGTVVDSPADPVFYARIAEAFPDAWMEDPKLTPETDEALRPHRDRVTWDANIHSVADVDGLPFAPKMVNVKPSRFGPLRELFRMYDTCEQRGIRMYGGGQFELGPGRGHIQLLASLFHPDSPNDVAPTGYNEPELPDGLPASPLPVAAHETGMRWG